MESVRRKLLRNPRQTANKLSVLLFLWTNKIFKIGCQRTIELTDLYETLSEDRSSNLGDRLEKCWTKEKNKKDAPSLIKAIASTFWKNYVFLGAICVLNDVIIRLTQPYLLGKLLPYFRQDSTMTFDDALWYAIAIVILNGLNMITVNQYFIKCFHIGMKMRVSLCSLIYRKALKLSQTGMRETTVINLLSNDVSRFDSSVFLIHPMWTAPLMTLIIAYFLWQQARWAGMIGIAIVFCTDIPIQTYTAKLSSIYRTKTAVRTDKRIKFMEEIITGVRVIKMFGWEIPFGKMIDTVRQAELNILQKSWYIRALYMTFVLFTTRLAVFCTMLSICILYGSDQITAAKIFVIAAYFHLIAHSMSQMFVRGIAELAEVYVSVKRLEQFMQYDEIDRSVNDTSETNNAESVAISVENLTASWVIKENSAIISELAKINHFDKDNLFGQCHTLEEINLTIKKGSLVGVVGPIGSGKSSFLQALLNEVPVESGSVKLNGSVSYASQEPWIFSGSVKQNIIFNNNFDEHRYDRVIRSCALDVDIGNFKSGDKLLIGDRGISLSGGQKARVNLARCMYHKADIYLFDDPLSAVDTHVGRHLFNECIGPNGMLAENGCTRILVTHQVHFLKEADVVVVFRNGKVDFHGTPTELSNLGIDFSEFLQMRHGGNDAEEEKADGISDEEKPLHIECDDELAKLEDVSKRKAKESTLRAYLRSGANCWTVNALFLLFIFAQILASGCDYWVAYWTGQEEKRNLFTLNSTRLTFERNDTEAVISINQSSSFNVTVPSVQEEVLLPTNWCMYIHGVLITTLFLVAFTRSISFYTTCVRASHALHNSMFNGIISTTLRFFDTNPSGRILNLFSKDLGIVDELLPRHMLDAVQCILMLTGSISLTLLVRPYFIVPVILIGIAFICVRKVYLNSSKDIKRIEGITRSPVFTHLAATMDGLPTIRAMNAHNVLTEEFDNHQDLHSSCWFMFISTSSAFGLCLDFLCFLIIAFTVFTFVLSGKSILGNEVGLVITQTMALTGMLQWGVRKSSDVTNYLMSVERIMQYRDLPSEQSPIKENESVPTGWPTKGKIEFRELSYRYSETVAPTLTKLNLIVQPNEKIGIVGRTGAGKSSLIGAIFRLAINEGDIFIDGVNTRNIDLYDLRSNISIIPQDPVLFSGTLRRNLDPFEKYTDADIWRALEDVELKHIATEPHGLQRSVLSNGSNFSVGEKQLLCLARAILQKTKILIADEATGNVSLSADELIQQKIRDKFADCTVLTIAHRLNTIIDSDRILVMGSGEILEFASPAELLESKGVFYGMISSLGKTEATRLTKVAVSKRQ